MPTRDPTCVFCDIVAGDEKSRIVSRRGGTTVFFPDHPATTGHLLVVPNEHTSDVWDLGRGRERELASEVQRVVHAVRDTLHPPGLNIIQSNGEIASQSVGHLHVHVLPRWKGDAVGELWPVGNPAWSEAGLDELRASFEAALPGAGAPGYDLSRDQDREDRRKHLELLAMAINRMAAASSAAKGWSLTLAGAAFGVAVVRGSWPLILLGIVVVAMFGVLDSRYLANEKRARGVHDDVVNNAVMPFGMSGLSTPPPNKRASVGSRVGVWFKMVFESWSVRLFYGPLVISGVVLLVVAVLTGAPECDCDDPPPVGRTSQE